MDKPFYVLLVTNFIVKGFVKKFASQSPSKSILICFRIVKVR